MPTTDSTHKFVKDLRFRSGLNIGTLRPDVFLPYVHSLATLLVDCAKKGGTASANELEAALDGQPSRELRKLYTADSLRNTGTYFTGSSLADRLVNPFKQEIDRVQRIVDPACGAGDLLVACARYLPVQSNLSSTLKEWGEKLAGFDVNSAFVDAARYRLALLALRRSSFANEFIDASTLPNLFPYIRCTSGLDDWRLQSSTTLIVINPPFSYGEAGPDCNWANGRVSQAAMFMDSCVNSAAPGTIMLAILPDVLRTGTRYGCWRKMISEKCRVHSVKIGGQFDKLTEVNVFLLNLEVGVSVKARAINWVRPAKNAQITVKDLFDIHVGPVVPFRLDGIGSWYPYANLENLPPWKTVRKFNQHLRFKGKTYKSPFVTIRRTSKSGCRFRCVGTIVATNGLIGIENHLLIAIPRDKKLRTCKKLLDVLKRDSTSVWMDKRMRCRHLTVSSVADIPWTEDVRGQGP